MKDERQQIQGVPAFGASGGEKAGLALGALLVVVLAAACAPERASEEPVVLEVEEVVLPETEVDLTTDRKAAPRKRPAGRLPGGFPEGLPVHGGATITDFGQGAAGDYVEFTAAEGVAALDTWYRSALAQAGWSVEPGSGPVLVASDGRRQVRIAIGQAGAVSTIRVEY